MLERSFLCFRIGLSKLGSNFVFRNRRITFSKARFISRPKDLFDPKPVLEGRERESVCVCASACNGKSEQERERGRSKDRRCRGRGERTMKNEKKRHTGLYFFSVKERGVAGYRIRPGLCHIKIGAISFQYVLAVSYRHDSFSKLQWQKKCLSLFEVCHRSSRATLFPAHQHNGTASPLVLLSRAFK